MKAIVLAGGKGKRLQSEQFDIPKVLRIANGKPLLHYVLNSIRFVDKTDIYIVVGYKQELVREFLGAPAAECDSVDYGGCNIVVQTEQLGTGHAAMMPEKYLKDYDGDILVCFGDMPLFTQKTMGDLHSAHKVSGNDCTILTDNFTGDEIPHYGRVVRENGAIAAIIEHKDCTNEQKQLRELSVGPMVINSKLLFHALSLVGNDNAQKEYYLTAVPEIVMRLGKRLGSYTTTGSNEIYGVNTPDDLEFCNKQLSKN